MDECFLFQPHLLALNLDLPEDETLNLVNRLREQEILSRVVLVLYSGATLTPESAKSFTLEPATLVRLAHVQPEQLERLLLTILRGLNPPAEAEEEISDISGVRAI